MENDDFERISEVPDSDGDPVVIGTEVRAEVYYVFCQTEDKRVSGDYLSVEAAGVGRRQHEVLNKGHAAVVKAKSV